MKMTPKVEAISSEVEVVEDSVQKDENADLDHVTEVSDSEGTESSLNSIASSKVGQPLSGKEDGSDDPSKSVKMTTTRGVGKMSLKDRSRVPPGMIVVAVVVFTCIHSSGLTTNFFTDTLPVLRQSISHVNSDFAGRVSQLWSGIDAAQSCGGAEGGVSKLSYYTSIARMMIGASVLCSIYYVLLYKPLKAGMWGPTQRATRHLLHRYMGLAFIIQYSYAWYEFLTDYEGSAQFSYLPITVALNGTL
jgi:hypothetical protein